LTRQSDSDKEIAHGVTLSVPTAAVYYSHTVFHRPLSVILFQSFLFLFCFFIFYWSLIKISTTNFNCL